MYLEAVKMARVSDDAAVVMERGSMVDEIKGNMDSSDSLVNRQ
jgi:hypothetical protein